jgi:competence protein ComFB
MAAKKSNKTEHVLKLITKNDEASREDDYFSMDQEIIPEVEAKTSADLPQEDVIPAPVQAIEQEATAVPAQAVKQEAPVVSAQEEVAAPVQQPKEPPTVRAFREQESAGTTATVIPEQSDDLVNIAEVLAREKLALVMERMKVCTCKTCVNDVLALALNSLPTKYVTTDAGKQYFQLDVYKKQYETDILAALTKACVRVKASPRH